MKACLNERGVLQLPMALALLMILLLGLGLHSTLRLWRKQVALQYRLDRCVARTARTLKQRLVGIERDNRALQVARLAVLTAKVGGSPPAIVAAEAAARALHAHQEGLLIAWRAGHAGWLARSGCDARRGDLALPWGELPYERLPDDTMGPGLLRWTGDPDHRFRILVRNSKRVSIALIEGESRAPHHWKLHWSGLP